MELSMDYDTDPECRKQRNWEKRKQAWEKRDRIREAMDDWFKEQGQGQEDCQMHVRLKNAQGFFITFRREYVQCGFLKRMEALFWEDLENLAQMAGTKWKGEFFQCSNRYL